MFKNVRIPYLLVLVISISQINFSEAFEDFPLSLRSESAKLKHSDHIIFKKFGRDGESPQYLLLAGSNSSTLLYLDWFLNLPKKKINGRKSKKAYYAGTAIDAVMLTSGVVLTQLKGGYQTTIGVGVVLSSVLDFAGLRMTDGLLGNADNLNDLISRPFAVRPVQFKLLPASRLAKESLADSVVLEIETLLADNRPAVSLFQVQKYQLSLIQRKLKKLGYEPIFIYDPRSSDLRA